MSLERQDEATGILRGIAEQDSNTVQLSADQFAQVE
jgi:hypothetical protein